MKHLESNGSQLPENQKTSVTAQKIVNDILFTDEPENIREMLHELMMAFFLYHDSTTQDLKEQIYTSYQALYDALKDMETLKERRA